MSTNLGDFDQDALTTLISDFNDSSITSGMTYGEKAWLTNTANAAAAIAQAQNDRSSLLLGDSLLYDEDSNDLRDACK
jgi:hypothetical protein